MQPVPTASSPRSELIDPACFLDRKRSQHIGLLKTVVVGALAAALIGYCQPNDPSCRNNSIGPSGSEVVGAAVGVGAVIATAVALEMHHAHHTLSGCVTHGPGGMQLRAYSGSKTYMLSGNTAHIVTGEHVRLHGTKVKPSKHSNIDPTFLVERENKDYGPCKLRTLRAATP